MSSAASRRPNRSGIRVPLLIAGVYAFIGAIWILSTDHLLRALVDDPAALTRMQTYKGWLFILVTAGLLYWLVNRALATLRRSDEELRRVNRVLHMLSDCNGAVLRAADESQLLQETCRLVVEVGGYQRAWVSLLEDGHPGTMRRVAEAGQRDADSISLDRVEADAGAGPLEHAVQAREPTIVREMPADPHRQAWRAATARRGSASLIVLPLVTAKRAYGTLTVCAAEPDAFDTEEVKLLEQLGGNVTYALTTLRSRAQHGQAEENLRESQRALATLMSNLPGMAYRCRNDRDWTMEFVSEGCVELTGYQAADLIHNNKIAYARLIHPEDEQVVWDDVQAAVTNKEPFRLVYRIRTAAGQEKWVWEQGRGIFSDHGDLLALEGFITDVTERKHLEEQLRHAQKMEAVGQVAGGVAHDFNNVLTAILGQLELIKSRPDSRERVKEGLAHIDQATQRAAALTRQLLAFSRRQVIKPEVLDLNQILEEIEPMLRHLIGEGVTLEANLAPGLGHVRADAGQIEQIVMNLVVNARDAMPDGGKLIIETTNVDLDDKYVAAHAGAQGGRHVLLTVSDTGCGMSAEVVERIFEPFYSTKAPGKGTGLGLWTVFGIVRQSGGNIWVYSEPDQGTTLKTYLPAVAEAVSARPAATRPAARGGTESILIVEDEKMVRELASSILRDRGYNVLVAGNGKTALELSAGHSGPIDLLITDVVMPDMNGADVAKALSQARPGLRVLFVSGHPSNVLAHHGVLTDEVELLDKPFGAEDLLHRVRELLDRDAPPPSMDQ